MAETIAQKALLDAFGYATEAYPVDMRAEENYEPYKIIFLGSASYNLKENKSSMRPTSYHLKKDWGKGLPKTTRKRREALDRKIAEHTKRSCFGMEAPHEIGISIGNTKYQLKDLVITDGEYESIPNDCWDGAVRAFQSNFLKLVGHGGGEIYGSGSRRLFAVVRESYYATVSAIIKDDDQNEVKAEFPSAEFLPSNKVTAKVGLSRQESLMQIGKGVIGILMSCFKMERQTSTDSDTETWHVSKPIPIGGGRKSKELRDQLIWTSRSLGRRFAMIWHPERFAFILMDTGKVLTCKLLDEKTKRRVQECMQDNTSATRGQEDDDSIDDDTAMGQQDDHDSREESGSWYFASLLSRIRGGGPDREIDTDGYVMGFDLRRLEETVMGLTLLPMSLEALDHNDFDTVIEWNTITKRIGEDGSKNIEIANRELPIQSVVDAKRQLLDFSLESLHHTEKKSGAKRKYDVRSEAEMPSRPAVAREVDQTCADSDHDSQLLGVEEATMASRLTTNESTFSVASNSSVDSFLVRFIAGDDQTSRQSESIPEEAAGTDMDNQKMGDK
jgi:hypothetical protein